MKKNPFYRRHPLFTATLLLLASLAVVVAVSLTQIDLDSVRRRLTQELSQILQQPVTIEKLHLTYQDGLAIDMHNLRIGDGNGLDIRVPQLTGILKLEPLLEGELKLDQVILSKPYFGIAAFDTPATSAQESAHDKADNLFNRFGISILSIRNGHLKTEWGETDQIKFPSQVENLNLILKGWASEQSGYLVISGNLPEKRGHFTVETELPPPSLLTSWQTQELKFSAILQDIPRSLLPDAAAQHLPDRFDARIQLNGAPVRGSKVRATLAESRSGSNVTSFAATWTTADQHDSLQFEEIRLFEIPMQGALKVNRNADSPLLLEGELNTENVDILPLVQRWEFSQSDKLLAGIVKNAHVKFSLPGKGTPSEQKPLYTVQASLAKGRWAATESDHLEQVEFDIAFDNHSLEITNGQARFLDQPLLYNAEVHNWRGSPLFTLELTAQPAIAALIERIYEQLPENLTLDGQIPSTLTLEGSRDQVRGELLLDLENLHTDWNPLILKEKGQAAQLSVKANWTPEQLAIELARLDFADLHMEGTADIPLTEANRTVSLQLNNIDIGALRSHSPLLQKLKAEGSLNIGLQKHPSGELLGRLKLNNVGAHLTKILADLNSATGTVDIHSEGLDFNNLNARLGQSPVLINGNLRNWKNFLLDLQVSTPQIRAQDLIFTNREMTIYDLDGRLLINKGGIIFDPVKVRLENGTDATVTGYVRNFKQPDTFLEIDSYEHADILEVINLFIGPPKYEPQDQAKKKIEPKPVRILARAAQGTLDGLNFQQAEGMIVNHRGLFTLYPLHFKHKDGYCLARVELENGRLKISGHVEDIDSSALYSEALKDKGLIKGKLRGDFYLEGNGTGKTFWASSKGGAHLEVRDGTLRKFRSLARIFSLLNVSQLFELKLPDMDSKGMPFTLLTASATIDNGVLTTDNLHIQSNAMNMSMIGTRDLLQNTIDLTVGVKPLRTVDKIITSIPVAGWLLAGNEKALLTAHFKAKGPADDPTVTAVPVSSLSQTVLGLVKRTLGLPGTLITDPEKLFFPGAETPPVEAKPTPQKAEPEEKPAEEAPTGTPD